MTAWFARLYSSIALSIRSSQRSGELQLISEIETGARSQRVGAAEQDLAPSRSCRARSRPRSPSPCRACPTASGARRPCRGGASRAGGPPARRSCRRRSRSRGTPAPSRTKFSKSAILRVAARRRPRARTAGRRRPRRPCGCRRCGRCAPGCAPASSNSLRRLRHLLEHELRVEEDLLALHRWPAFSKYSTASGSMNSTPSSETIRRQPPVEGVHRLLAEDLVAGHFVDEHGAPP